MDCNTGYLMPSSHQTASLLLVWSAFGISGNNSVSAKSVYRRSKYCRCPSHVCCRIKHRNIFFWLVHLANFLQKSIWHQARHLAGPCVLKFSVHPNMMISRTLCSTLCFFKLASFLLSTFVQKICLAKMLQFFCKTLQLYQIFSHGARFPALHIVFHHC